jgi:hypothetical protein
MAAGHMPVAVKNRNSCDFRHSWVAAADLVCQYRTLVAGGRKVRAFCLVIFFFALALRILASALDTGAEAATPAPAPATNAIAAPQR